MLRSFVTAVLLYNADLTWGFSPFLEKIFTGRHVHFSMKNLCCNVYHICVTQTLRFRRRWKNRRRSFGVTISAPLWFTDRQVSLSCIFYIFLLRNFQYLVQ